MSRTYRNERLKERTHDRAECPLCQENLHHKHAKRLPDEEEEPFEPDHVLVEWDD